MNRTQLDFVREMSDASQPEKAKRRRETMALMREQWFSDLARLYSQAVEAIEEALSPKASLAMRAATAKWLIEQRRGMVAEEREAEAEAEKPDPLAKPPSEMTIAELEASIAHLERIAAAESATEAEIVPESSIFD